MVDAMDGSLELCKAASEYTGITVRHVLLFIYLSNMEILKVKEKVDILQI